MKEQLKSYRIKAFFGPTNEWLLITDDTNLKRIHGELKRLQEEYPKERFALTRNVETLLLDTASKGKDEKDKEKGPTKL